MKIRTLTGAILAGVSFVAVATSPAFAGSTSKNVVQEEVVVEEAENWWSAELSAGWDSRYMFRGVSILGDSGIGWTDLSFSTYGFTLGAWYANGIDVDYSEIDLYASYAYSLGPVNLEGGGIYYGYPQDDGIETWELFLKVSTDVIPFLTPSLTGYWDIDAIEGGYLEFKLQSSIPVVADVVSIDPFASISYDIEYNSDSNDFNNVQVGVEVPVALSKNITLKGYVAYAWALDAIDDFQDDEFWGGASITFSF